MRTLAILVLLTSTAVAEPVDQPYAMSVNSPISWATGFAVAASGYGRISEHQALRLNVASYDYDANIVGQAVAGLAFGVDLDGVRSGRLLDVGAGWMYFPRRTFDGPLFEAGVMRRSGATSTRDSNMDPKYVDRDTQLYAARALVGWSWLFRDRVMVSFAAGAATGYELGSETTQRDSIFMEEPKTHDVAGWTMTVEGYFRLGFTFGR